MKKMKVVVIVFLILAGLLIAVFLPSRFGPTAVLAKKPEPYPAPLVVPTDRGPDDNIDPYPAPPVVPVVEEPDPEVPLEPAIGTLTLKEVNLHGGTLYWASAPPAMTYFECEVAIQDPAQNILYWVQTVTWTAISPTDILIPFDFEFTPEVWYWIRGGYDPIYYQHTICYAHDSTTAFSEVLDHIYIFRLSVAYLPLITK